MIHHEFRTEKVWTGLEKNTLVDETGSQSAIFTLGSREDKKQAREKRKGGKGRRVKSKEILSFRFYAFPVLFSLKSCFRLLVSLLLRGLRALYVSRRCVPTHHEDALVCFCASCSYSGFRNSASLILSVGRVDRAVFVSMLLVLKLTEAENAFFAFFLKLRY